MNAEEIIVNYKSKAPVPVKITMDGVTFELEGTLAIFYRWAEYLGILDEWMEDSKPYWLQAYAREVYRKMDEEERKMRDHYEYAEKRRLWENDKKRIRRMREKENSIARQDNAVHKIP